MDCCKEAIEDAHQNVKQNNVSNASFSCGLTEDEVARLISQIKVSCFALVDDMHPLGETFVSIFKWENVYFME